MALAGSWSDVGGGHSKHRPFRLKVTIGCPRCYGVLCVHEVVVLCGVLCWCWCLVVLCVGVVWWCGVVVWCLLCLLFLSVLFFLFLALALSFSSLLSFSLHFSPRRPLSRYLKVIWRTASAQQSVLSLLLPSPFSPSSPQKEGTFHYRII